MRISEQRKNEIVRAFQFSFKRDNTPEIEGISLIELRQADEMLGHRDESAGFRIALRNRIHDLEEHEKRGHESKIRAWNLVTGIIAGLVIAGLAALLFAK